MKRLISIFLLVVTLSTAAERLEPDPTTFPMTGLTSIDLRHVISVAATNMPAGATIRHVFVLKDSVSVSTTIIQEGATDLGNDYILKMNGNRWVLTETTRTKYEILKIGMSASEIDSLLLAVPLGPKILSLQVTSANIVSISTGRIDGPLSGRGIYYEYEKRENKWEKTVEGSWVS